MVTYVCHFLIQASRGYPNLLAVFDSQQIEMLATKGSQTHTESLTVPWISNSCSVKSHSNKKLGEELILYRF